ncbi:uncharacterized protein LOC129220945 [Uloborus diversus]|uniref:uncharacterized protein LOC129220945 n=1 Tax=Uloborus diversus TaxID=327109 RepID=UPI0024092CD6|nr:uncharacterized protein LOC129220945 [Uloborus diversus]
MPAATIIMYDFPLSPACRCVKMLAYELNIELELKNVDLLKREQFKPEFLKINCQHRVPVINDNGFYLSESRAIMMYLIRKYAPESPLYPTDLKERAIVDQTLNYDLGTLFRSIADFLFPQIFFCQPSNPKKEGKFMEAVSFLEEYLKSTSYSAADYLTIADYTIYANLSMMELINFDFSPYPRVVAYMNKMKSEIPLDEEINRKAIADFAEIMKSKILKDYLFFSLPSVAMPITLYDFPLSPACRSVKMLAYELNIELKLVNVDLVKNEQHKPEFLKLNVQHSVPVIDDNGFILSESRAILQYLVDKYAPDSPLYPKDLKERARIDRMLNFDEGDMFRAIADFMFGPTFLGKPTVPKKEKKLHEVLGFLEEFLKTTSYVATDYLTIADYAVYADLNMMALHDVDISNYPKILAYMEKMKSHVPLDEEINQKAIANMKLIIEDIRAGKIHKKE